MNTDRLLNLDGGLFNHLSTLSHMLEQSGAQIEHFALGSQDTNQLNLQLNRPENGAEFVYDL